MIRKKICLFIILMILGGFLKAYGQDDDELFKLVEVKDGTTLSVIDCVAVAFKNSPKIKRKKYNLDIGQ